jgi:hypothetical protein
VSKLLLLLFHEVSRLVTTPGDFEVSPSAKHRRLLEINRFKNKNKSNKIKTQNK